MTNSKQAYFVQSVMLCAMFLAVLNFAFEGIQGEYGLFARVNAQAEQDRLSAELANLNKEIATMENLTTRLSDQYLDLDLLDQQARSVLGVMRPDELVLR